MKEKELRDLIDSLRLLKRNLWENGLGVVCFFFFALLPFVVLEEAGPLFYWWSVVLGVQGIMCFARFLGALRLRG